MKKTALSLIAIVFTINFSYAQWTGGPTGPIYYNGGNVGIGTTSPRDRLDLSANRGFNLIIGDRASYGSLLSSAGTVIGQNVKADNTINGQMSYINTTSDGASAIKLQYDEGITFHTNYSGGTAGNAFSAERVRITPQGNVGIGTNDTQGYKLAVNGNAVAESITVKLHGSWPDYVLRPKYHLPTLTEVKNYIDQNHHLPEMPSAEQVAKDGLSLGDMNAKLLKKVEELTLYILQQNERINKLEELLKPNPLK